jgi:hypothetical protein
MGLIRTLSRVFTPSEIVKERAELKEIFCKRKGEDFIKRFRTPVVGSEYSNLDGSDRQEAMQKVKEGQKVRLIWDAASPRNKSVVYLLRGGKKQKLSMPDCFGRLNDKVGAEVVRWLTQENIVTSARVAKIVGGTRKRPKLSCILELTTYPGPEQKK